MWHTGLVAPQHVGSSQTRAQTRVPCIGRWILNHCATREVPSFCCFPAILGIPWLVDALLQSLLWLSYGHLSSVSLASYEDANHIGVGAHPTQYDLIFTNYICKDYFQIRSLRYWGLGFQHIFWGEHSSTHNTFYVLALVYYTHYLI